MAEDAQEGRMMEKEQDKSMKIGFEPDDEHIVQACICLKCFYRWIDVRHVGTLLQDLECPNCGRVWYVIGTGEVLE